MAEVSAFRIDLFDVGDARGMQRALEVRTEVFVGEQHVPPEEEIDEHDRTDGKAAHAIVWEGSAAIAAGRFYEIDRQTVQIGRMAVRSRHRGRGAGAVLLRALLDEARRRGYSRATLHAQVHATGFYRKAGFTPFGGRLYDAGIEHQPMELTLEESRSS